MLIRLCAFFLLVFSLPAFAKAPPKNTNVNYDLEKLLATNDYSTLNIGIIVKNLDTNKIIYKKNSQRYFNPASNQKLFTAAAALTLLGPQFTYQTELWLNPTKLNQAILHDNVYLKFNGDPTLTLDQLDHLLSTLASAGIHTINGTLIIDDSKLDQQVNSPGSSWDDQNFCFGAPISAANVEHNCFILTVTPNSIPGQLANLTLPTRPSPYHFHNNVMTLSSESSTCKITATSLNATTFEISGCIKNTDNPQELKLAITQPHAYLEFIVNALLKKNNIHLAYPIKFDHVGSSATLFAKESSPTVRDLIITMLKDSDNLIANALFKTMGAIHSHTVGTWENSAETIKDLLAKHFDIDTQQIAITDGAGSSRYDYLTPQHILILLTKMYQHKTELPEFIRGLPIAGIDGTLQDRMQATYSKGKVLAKTGTATGITALSGYLETQKHHTLAFSLIINGFIEPQEKYKNLEDKICEILIKKG